MPVLVIGGIVAAILAVAAFGLVAIYLGQDREDQPRAGGGPAGDGATVLILDWPDDQRKGAVVELDGKEKKLPESGKVKYKVEPGDHKLKLIRRGYDQIEVSLSVDKGEQRTYKPKWEEVVAAFDAPQEIDIRKMHSFDGWLQDLAAAKQSAQAENKDLLIAFLGSDWCPPCQMMIADVFHTYVFRERIKDRYVLVYLDFPRFPTAMNQVENQQRNREMADLFGVDGFPTVVLADSQGRAYSYLSFAEDVDSFLQAVEEAGQVRTARDEAFAAVDAATGPGKLAAAEEALNLLDEQELLRSYAPVLKEWADLAEKLDPDNAKGKNEMFFEAHWTARLARLKEGPEAKTRAWVARLDQWTKTHKVKDPDSLARMHLLATVAMLVWLDDKDAAKKHADAGVAARPNNSQLLAMLRWAQQAVSGELSSGTAFVVAVDPENNAYLLTNHHVIEGEGKLVARIPGMKNTVPAKVLAQDEPRDMALVRIKVPQGRRLRAIRISTAKVGRGLPVATLGYAADDVVGSNVKLTEGIISAMPEPGNQEMIVLDCTVNPGNSGGPLFNEHAEVVGMVTAKTGAGGDKDSYGMALPADDLLAFLKKNFPNYRPGTGPSAKKMNWFEVDQLFSGSVIMLMKVE